MISSIGGEAYLTTMLAPSSAAAAASCPNRRLAPAVVIGTRYSFTVGKGQFGKKRNTLAWQAELQGVVARFGSFPGRRHPHK